MKRGAVLIVGAMIVLLIFLVSLGLGEKEEVDKVDNHVLEELNKTNNVSVVIDYKQGGKEPKVPKREQMQQINNEKMNELARNPKVVSVRKADYAYVAMQDAVGIVNATPAWASLLSGINITGTDETICIIDTGVDFSHSDLVGKNRTCNIDCINEWWCFENCTITDDHGHGTHVAGIAAASGSIKGVSPGAGIIAVKALRSNGAGLFSDIVNGTRWCLENSGRYNISVISLSLGGVTNYTTYCDNIDNDYNMTEVVNNATFHNISIIAATGNNYNYTAVSWPSCIENITAVVATSKSDTLESYSSRNNLVDLASVGTSINSTKKSGGYEIRSGTSMAAPNVAGAYALLQQFYRLEFGRKALPSEVKAILNSTGKLVTDSVTGLNFSRINIYSAMLGVDSIAPSVSLITPGDNSYSTSLNQTLKCNASDFLLSNITLRVWNSSSLYYNLTQTATRSFASVEFNLTLVGGSYKWNCISQDFNSSLGYANSNFSLNITNIALSLVSPENNSYKTSWENFSCQANSTVELANMSFYLWNSSTLIYNKTKTISGLTNNTEFNYTLIGETRYYWSCLVLNNNSESFFAANNTIVLDKTSPEITLNAPSADYSTYSSLIDFNFNVSDSEIANCSLLLSNVAYESNSTLSSTGSIWHSFSTGSYSWRINCTDRAGNMNSSETRALTRSQELVGASSGGGGSSGAASLPAKTIEINENQVESGYQGVIAKGDTFEVKISIGEHTIKLNNITDNKASITVSSTPQTFLLSVGESVKVNLNGDNLYDLLIKLDKIENSKANFTIKKINEEIIKSVRNETKKELRNETFAFEDNQKQDEKSYIFWIVLSLIIVAGVIGGFILFRKNGKEKTETNKTKSKRK